jgi:hypothetical protein
MSFNFLFAVHSVSLSDLISQKLSPITNSDQIMPIDLTSKVEFVFFMSRILGTQDEKKWRSRGADPNIESFYTTEYASHYTRPYTTRPGYRSCTLPPSSPPPSLGDGSPVLHDLSWTSEYTAKYTPPTVTIGGVPNIDGTIPTTRQHGSGYASNHHVSPLDLETRPDRQDYQVSHSNATHTSEASLFGLMTPKPIVRAAMEKSGYWTEPLPNVIYESPAQREITARETRVNAAGLDPITLKRMTRHNAIDAENKGAGPDWGSTTYSTAYHQHPSNHDRYWQTDRTLIGKREPDAFTRQHITIPKDPVDEQESIYTTSYRAPQQSREIHIPDRVVMERSGFTYSSIPIQNRNVPLSDVNPDDLPSLTRHRIKHRNTPEYQNLYEPNPYKTTHEVSYKPPLRTIERALTPGAAIKRGATGYDSNETMHVGIPGDPRRTNTGITEFQGKYVDPMPGIRARGITGCPNVMERSGYWSQ